MVDQIKMSPSGPNFSELVQGYWRMADWGRSAQDHLRFLEQHIELGITTVDHAHVYAFDREFGCEALFGQTLALAPQLREQIQIVTKCGIELFESGSAKVNHYDSSAEAVQNSVECSLRRLGIEQIDVLLIHRPDWLMDVDELAEVFTRLQEAGKVAHFGVSNFTSSQFELLQSRLRSDLVTNQIEINPINFDAINNGTLDQMQQRRVRPMAWSCLAGGMIFDVSTDRLSRLNKCLFQVAEECDVETIDEIVYAWVMMLPSKPVPIIGSGSIDRVEKAVNSLKIKLSREQWYRILVASMGQNVP